MKDTKAALILLRLAQVLSEQLDHKLASKSGKLENSGRHKKHKNK